MHSVAQTAIGAHAPRRHRASAVESVPVDLPFVEFHDDIDVCFKEVAVDIKHVIATQMPTCVVF